MSAYSGSLPHSEKLHRPMKFSSFLHNPFLEELGIFRWIIAGAIVLSIHGAFVFWLLYHRENAAPPGEPLPAILVDLAPMPASPPAEAQPEIGPAMQQAMPEETVPEALPEPEKEPVPEPPVMPIEAVPPAPQNEKAVAVLPPPPKPAPAHPVPPKPEHKEIVKHEKKPPAPRTSAPAPSVNVSAQRAAQMATGSLGAAASADALAAWHARLSAQLKSKQHYPEAARAKGQQGVAYLSFTIDRSGRVLSARISQSSGSAELDEETIALARRSSPLPPPPPEVAGGQFPFTLPIRFSVR